jgi:hypothetical protein
MEKKFFALSLCFFLSHFSTSHALDKQAIFNIFGWFTENQPSSQQYPTPNKNIDWAAVRQQVRSAFDNALATSYHPSDVQKEITQKREKASNEIIYELQYKTPLSEQEAKQEARKLAQLAALQFVIDKTEEISKREIQKIRTYQTYLISNYVSDEQITQAIKQKILNEARPYLDKYGVLRDLIGNNLEKKIKFLAETELGIHERQALLINYEQQPRYNDYSALPPHAQPSAPPADQVYHQGRNDNNNKNDDIYEIYPLFGKNELEHEKYFARFNKTGKDGIFRENECCTCNTEFGTEVQYRVNLPCGHSNLCQTCSYQWFYKENKNTCPTCREKIDKSTIPAQYIKDPRGYLNRNR